jgi:hypothetical protein
MLKFSAVITLNQSHYKKVTVVSEKTITLTEKVMHIVKFMEI